ncbi:MAG: hypothetical protein M3N54_11335 [Acidobacteriota bacterium]|nr:hypothetical protein [Acidobacteriota bacterium]
MDKIIGEPLERVDGRLKVTGRATYTADWNIPNVAHAVLVTSAIAKGTIASINTSAAEQVPGVLAVLTHKNKLKVAKIRPSAMKTRTCRGRRSRCASATVWARNVSDGRSATRRHAPCA